MAGKKKKNGKKAKQDRPLARAMALSSSFPGVATNGTYTGASERPSLASWLVSSGDADSDLLHDLPLLRDRSQELFKNAPAGRGVIKRLATGAIGAGLTMRSTIDYHLLGITLHDAKEWQEKAEREFRVWAESRDCDYSRRLTFNEIQLLAFTSQKVRGDCFVLMPWVKRKGVPYELCLQLVEADRVTNPEYAADTDEVTAGIKRDINGVPESIYVQSVHPGDAITTEMPTWEEVPLFGLNSGRRNVLHLMEFERIDQSRGEPVLAPVIETLKQLTRYSEAELSAAVVNAFFAVFIKQEFPPDNAISGIDLSSIDAKTLRNRGPKLLKSATVMEGAPGENLEIVEAKRPSQQFDGFFAACLKQIGMAIGVPFEVLLQHFQSSYSASRAALLEYAKSMKVSRNRFTSSFCQPVYEAFLTEAILKGRVFAPGFLADPIIRSAYCRADWVGPSAGQIDPVKEVQAAKLRVDYGFSTMGRETAELTGMDFEQVTATRAEEQQTLRDAGLNSASLFAGNDDGEGESDREEREEREKDGADE